MARNYPIFHDPELLQLMIDIYFEQMEQDELPPTVPGLVLILGMTRVQELTKLLERYDAQQSELEAAENDCLIVGDDPVTRHSKFPYPADAMDNLIRALTRIEAYQLSHGLRDLIPVALVKFTLGAYHNVKEVSAQQQQGGNTVIQIAFEAPPKSMQLRSNIEEAQRRLPQTTPVVNSNVIEVNYAAD